MVRRFRLMVVGMTLLLCSSSFRSAASVADAEIVGRWDLTVGNPPNTYPSWLEVTSANGRLSGRFVGKVGSARVIRQIEFVDGALSFSLPPQYENTKANISFQGTVAGEELKGTTQGEDGSQPWTGVRAPDLPRKPDLKWGKPVQLFNGKDLKGWKLRPPKTAGGWKVAGGVLENRTPSCDIMTELEFTDFKLHVEFSYPPKGNSGIYLRGRYEVQIQDDIGKPPESHFIGGVYGFIDPMFNAAKKAGEWQTYDLTLMGRWVTVVLNGKTVIDNRAIPGITGRALNSREADPGPIMLQGDHTDASFRNIIITPAVPLP